MFSFEINKLSIKLGIISSLFYLNVDYIMKKKDMLDSREQKKACIGYFVQVLNRTCLIVCCCHW